MTLNFEGAFFILGEKTSYFLGVLGLSGTRFTSNKHGLVLVILKHVTVGLIGDGEEMGWHFSS